MTDTKISLSSDTVLIRLHGGVTGITRRATAAEEERDGKAVTTTREITTRQADEVEATRAKKLLNALRSLVDKNTTTCVGMVITNTAGLKLMREEIAPIRAQIAAHNDVAKYHHVDYSFIAAPISLSADPAALAEVCRQIADELKVALAFFTPAPLPSDSDGTLEEWNVPVKNWIARTKGLDKLFPTITGQMIGEALQSVRDLREKVAASCKAFGKAGQSDESALRSALQAVAAVPGSLGLIENAIGFVTITDGDAKAANDEQRAEGAGAEIH